MSPASERSPLSVALVGARPADDLGIEVAGDYGDPTAEWQALRTTAGMFDRSSRGTVVVHGPDAQKFLQALLSADVDALVDGTGTRTLFLTPQGRLDVEARMLRVDTADGPEFWLDTDVGAAVRLATGLLRFRLRTKVDIDDRTATFAQLGVRGPDATSSVSQALDVTVPDAIAAHAHVAWRGARVVRADWPDRAGVDVTGPVADVTAAWEALLAHGVARAGLEAYEAARIEAGVPRLGPDLDERVLAHEAFLDRDAVSFTKGCFLGQEVVCRIDSRGRVNRFLRGLRVVGDEHPPVGSEVVVDDRVVGTLTSVAAPPDGGPVVALAYVRREVEPPTTVTLRWDGGSATADVRSVVAEV